MKSAKCLKFHHSFGPPLLAPCPRTTARTAEDREDVAVIARYCTSFGLPCSIQREPLSSRDPEAVGVDRTNAQGSCANSQLFLWRFGMVRVHLGPSQSGALPGHVTVELSPVLVSPAHHSLSALPMRLHGPDPSPNFPMIIGRRLVLVFACNGSRAVYLR